MGIVSFILKGCEPPDPEAEDKAKAPAAESVRTKDAAAVPDAAGNEGKEDTAPAVDAANQAVTAPESAPQA